MVAKNLVIKLVVTSLCLQHLRFKSSFSQLSKKKKKLVYDDIKNKPNKWETYHSQYDMDHIFGWMLKFGKSICVLIISFGIIIIAKKLKLKW